jgi:hypothetical protein
VLSPAKASGLRQRLTAAAPLGLVLGVAHWQAWPLLRETPLSHDHPVHLYHAWHFWTELLGRGRVQGWSHFWGFGYPAGELSPFGADAWVACFRLVSFWLPWTRTYGLALAGLFVFAAYAMFVFARRHVGLAAAVIAALLWLLDPGYGSHGGWGLTMGLGVWPVLLGMSFVLLGLTRLEGALSAGHRRDVLGAGLWLGAALLTHQLSLVVCLVAAPLLWLDHWTRPTGLGPGATARLLGALGLAGAQAGLFLVPMLARSDATPDVGMLGISVADLGRRLIELQVYNSMWPVVTVFGLLGCVLALRRRLTAGLFLTASAGVFVLLSSDLLVHVLHAERLTAGVLKLEAPRMLVAAKLFWFPLVAYAAVTVLRRPVGLAGGYGGSRRIVRWLVCLLLLVPVIGPAWQRLYAGEIAKTLEPPSPYWTDLQTFFEWSRIERAQSSEHYRIAYALPTHDHIATTAPVFDQTLFYKIGYTPVQQFRSFPLSGEPALLEALSVKYVLAGHLLESPDFSLERDFGQLKLHRFRRYRPQPFTLIGSGKAELVRFDPERIELRLSGIAPGSRLKLHVANFDRWQATLGGREVPISPAPVHGFEQPILMEVPAADGDLVFRYVRRAPDWIGLVLSLSALPGFFLIGWVVDRRNRHPRLDRSIAVLQRCLDRLRWPALGCVGLAIAWAFSRLADPSPRLPGDSLFLEPGRGEFTLGAEPCVPSDTLSWACGPHRVQAALVNGELEHGLFLCMTAPAVGTLGWTGKTRLGRFLGGRYYPARNSAQIRATVDGRLLGEVESEPQPGDWHELQFLQFDTREYAGKESTLHLELQGGALRCFDFRKLP